jgi:hypothetical protein
VVWLRRNRAKTATDVRTPASKYAILAVQTREKGEGKWRGVSGGLGNGLGLVVLARGSVGGGDRGRVSLCGETV